MTLTNTWKNSLPKSLVFIDSNLEKYQFLKDGVHQSAEVVILESGRNGIEQINEAIENFASQQGLIEAVQIFSHGSPGSLQLGNSFLNSDNLESYGQILSSWKKALTNKANILLYGCRVAAGIGAEFIVKLQEIIGVNIAASVNLTGSSKLGGNWDLEFTTGEILVPIALTEIAQENYPGVLATLTVTNSNDSGEGSLREAIATAEAGDTIIFDRSLANQTITLTTGQLEIDKDLIIDGVNSPNLTISGNEASRIFDVQFQKSFTLKNLTIIDGKTTEEGKDGNGGALKTSSQVTLTIENSDFLNNVTSGEGGGAISAGNRSNTTITNSTFDGNDATAGQNEHGGGAIITNGLSVLTIQNSEFTNNKGINGGAINTPSTALTIENSEFINNDTTAGASIPSSSSSPRGFGGAIYTDGVSASFTGENGSIIIRDSLFENNQGAGAGGALYLFTYPGDKVFIEDTKILNNSVIFNDIDQAYGGGIRLSTGRSRIGRTTPVQYEVTDTTFAGNTAESQGGGLWIDRKLDLTRVSIVNSTFSENKAENPDGTVGLGGAIATYAPTTITNTTIANNSAAQFSGAIYTTESTGFTPDIQVTNTILDRNTAGQGNTRKQQTNLEFRDGGGNLQFPEVENNGEVLATANTTIADPQLGELQEINGALVRPLQPGSPAIDAGTNRGAPTTDQRGQERLIDGDGNGSGVTDVGAYEFVGDIVSEPNNPPTVANNGTLTLDEGASFTITTNELQVTDADGDPITFQIDELPDNGILQLNNTNLTVNDTFSQTDLDNGNVSYSHDGSETTGDSFSLSASDGNGGNTGNIDVIVAVNAVNDSPTNINLSNDSIEENSELGAEIGILSTEDADTADTHTYSLIDDAEGRFSIEGDRLLVADGSKLDFESNDGHNITVETTDSGTPSQSFEKQLTIGVTDVEENNPPTNINLSNESIEENSELGAEIGILSTEDADSDDTHTYSLIDDAEGRFSIEGDRLLVADGSKLDFESNDRHNITVETTDSGTPSSSFEKQLTIGVTEDENNHPTDILVDNAGIEENSENGAVIGNLSTIDPDLDDTHTYTLLDDADGRFAIEGDRLLVADGSKLDFESDPSHSITIQTTDSGTFSKSFAQQLTLQIADVEENNSPMDIAIDNAEIAENSDNGAEIGILSTRDVDPGDTHTYTLLDDADGRFSIEGDRLLVADGSKLDFESNRRHNITVQTTDSGSPNKSLEKELTIGVSDVEELPPGLNLQGTQNDDRLVGGANRDTLTGAGGSDTLIGGGDRDELRGGGGSDILNGGAGNDVLNGGLGSDVMRGGLGNDSYVADGRDEIIENADEGKDTVQVSSTYRLPDNLERLVLVGSDNIDGTGNAIDNAIAGNDGNNKLVGAAGNDTIWGVGGDDTLIGSRGQDILFGGSGNDLLQGRLGRDRLNGNSGNDTLVGGVGIDRFIFNTNEEFVGEDLGTDVIADFNKAHGDLILLDKQTFTAITSDKGDGFSVGGEFEVVNSDAAAAVSDAVVVYNQTNGNLFYNANGSSGGLGDGGLFATLTDAPTLAESDFLIR